MSAFMYSIGPNLIPSPSPFPCRTTRNLNPIFPRTHLIIQRPLWRESVGVARFGLGQVPFPDPEDTELIVNDLFGRIEAFVYTIADAAVNSSQTVDSVTSTKQTSDWLSGITNAMETVLKVLKDGLSTLHVPYAYGFAIILLTVIVKAATFPLTKKQVESAMAMQSLAPRIKAIQEQYAGDQERIQLETARLYKSAGINPLAGCLPTLATIPIWIGLYRALSNVANEGLLTEGFFWIPSLSGPTTIAAQRTGSGTSWLFPFVDGHPPLGWSDTLAYLVLPVLLVISQYVSVQIMQPPQSNDPAAKNSQAITKLLPLMIGYFALSVPSGLSLYWFTNNILSTVQQVWLRKLGGAQNPLFKQFSEDTVKKEQARARKSISEAATKKIVADDKEEKPTSGPRPGERFKQLKEQEARRRQQREEEKRRAEEASAKFNTTAGDDIKEETSTTKREDSSNRNISNATSVVNGNNGFSVNGNAKPNKEIGSLDDKEESPGLVSDDRMKERSTHSGEKVE